MFQGNTARWSRSGRTYRAARVVLRRSNGEVKRMADLEKVKKGLECCHVSMGDDDPFGKCKDCPYNDESIYVEDCRAILSRDALEVILGG